MKPRPQWFKKTHGMKGTPTYKVWTGIKQRCKNSNDQHYPSYGGRGITLCPRWESFVNFLEDMGERPKGMYIDRIDNDGPYSPGNCRWVTPRQSSNNRRNSRLVTMNGKTLTLTAWCQELGLKEKMVYRRVYDSGWTPEEALTIPKVPASKRHGWKDKRKEDNMVLREGTCSEIGT